MHSNIDEFHSDNNLIENIIIINNLRLGDILRIIHLIERRNMGRAFYCSKKDVAHTVTRVKNHDDQT